MTSSANQVPVPGTSRLAAIAPVVAATIWFMVFAAGTVSIMHCVGRDFAPLPLTFARGPIGSFAIIGASLAFATFGSILASRLPRNLIGWLLLGTGLLIATVPVANVLVAMALEVFRPASTFTVMLAWFTSSAVMPVVLALLIAVLLAFPTGRPLRGAWMAGLWLAGTGAALLTVGTGFSSRGLLWYPALANPLAVDRRYEWVLDGLRVGGMLLVLAALLLAVASMLVRYRDCDETVRRQLRWMVVCAVAIGVTHVPFIVSRYVLAVNEADGERLLALAAVAAAAFPAVTAVAVSRFVLVEVDLLISRTLVYVPLMAIFGGLYSAMLVLFQRVFVSFTGNASDIAAVITALVVASAFTSVRRTLENVVERRLGRGRTTVTPAEYSMADEHAALVQLQHRLHELEAMVEATPQVSASRVPVRVETAC